MAERMPGCGAYTVWALAGTAAAGTFQGPGQGQRGPQKERGQHGQGGDQGSVQAETLLHGQKLLGFARGPGPRMNQPISTAKRKAPRTLVNLWYTSTAMPR